MNRIKFISNISLFCFLFIPVLYGQTDIRKTKLFWVSAGGGISLLSDEIGLIFNTTLNYYNEGLFTLRFAGLDKPKQKENIIDISCMYGLAINYSILFLTASTGLGVVWQENNLSGRDRSVSAGFPIEFHAFISPLPILGFGFAVTANINSGGTYSGVVFSMHLGKLR